MKNEIDADFLKERLADEQDILKAELISEKILTESAAQQVINAAFGVLETAIISAL